MKISIIIPTYNVEAYIEECLESVAAQTWQGELECIVVDDCGQDDSILKAQRFIDAYNGHFDFSILHREKNGGLSAARNSGLKVATGDYVYFLDSDDCITTDCIKQLVEVVEKNKNIDVAQGGIINSDGSANYDTTCLKEVVVKSADEVLYKELVYGKIPVSSWNKLIRREVLFRNNTMFCEGVIHEDVDFLYKLAKCIKSLAICNANTYIYRIQREGSILNTASDERSTRARIKVYSACLANLSDAYRQIGVKSIFVRIMFVICTARIHGETKRQFDDLAHRVANEAYGLDKTIMKTYLILPRFLQCRLYDYVRRRLITQ